MMVAGVVLWYRINRQKFNRRNVAGLETFDSYGQSVGVGCLERFGKLAALVLIVGGFFLSLSGASSFVRTLPKQGARPSHSPAR